MKRPEGSQGTTDDSKYAPPASTCKGHTLIDKIKDILNPDKDPVDMDQDDDKKSEKKKENEQKKDDTSDQKKDELTVIPE